MTSDNHIVTAYGQELEDLNHLFREMADHAFLALEQAMQAVESRDSELAEWVRANDQKLDAMEHDMEAKVMRILALRQPMAIDLRFIIAILKGAALLERVGDFAKNISKRLPALRPVDDGKIEKTLYQMSRKTQTMLSDVVDGFFDQDEEKILAVWQSDPDVDALYTAVTRTLLTYMMEDPRNISPCTHFLFIAKNLERTGDHATNLAEIAYYYITGEVLTENRPKGGNFDEVLAVKPTKSAKPDKEQKDKPA